MFFFSRLEPWLSASHWLSFISGAKHITRKRWWWETFTIIIPPRQKFLSTLKNCIFPWHNYRQRDCWQWKLLVLNGYWEITAGLLGSFAAVCFSWNCCQGFSRPLLLFSFIAAVRPSSLLSSSTSQPSFLSTSATTSPLLSSRASFPSPLFTPACFFGQPPGHLADIFAPCCRLVNVIALLEWSCLHLISPWAEAGKISLPACGFLFD